MSKTLLEKKLLAVPFNDDHHVDRKIKTLLTEKEFFEECFLRPDFDEDIKELLLKSTQEISAFEIDLSVQESINVLEKHKIEKEELFNWIDENQNEIYCVKGDAGTGKSTFLHYLKYIYYNTDIKWEIIDIKKAVKELTVLGRTITINNFNNLYNKTISTIILYIRDVLFYFDESMGLDTFRSIDALQKLVENYDATLEPFFVRQEVNCFFDNLRSIIKSLSRNRKKCEKCAEYISNYFNELLKEDCIIANSVAIELLICIITSIDTNKRFIIAFDNFERFVGTDEIYCRQLTEFVTELRNIQNSITANLPNLSNRFQIIIFMRNTSTRMFTPQQVAELVPHRVDLSDWFQSSKIVQKKIDWYNKMNISIEGAETIIDILDDIGRCDNSFRGLRSKLNMLFNNNKRVIIRFLIDVLRLDINQSYISIYEHFKKNEYGIDSRIARFGARMIIYRLILNQLRKDGFFKNIIVQRSDTELSSLGYARKILTILYDYKLENINTYMDFEEIIKLLFPNNNDINDYFDDNNAAKRDTISQILYYMNYYNIRSNNWLQFIDIQYNIDQENVKIKDYQDLKSIIDNNFQDVKIRITSAGMAYLFFVVYSFEYFSSKSIYCSEKNKIFGHSDLPPIFAVIPSYEEIIESNINDLTCVKVIKSVQHEACICLEKMETDNNNIFFRYSLANQNISHSMRIINSHTGLIDNYLYCIKEIHKKHMSNDSFSLKLDLLISEIEEIKSHYNKYRK